MKIERAAERAQVRDAGADVRLHLLRRRLLHVRHVVEVVVALLDAGRAAEVVERDRGDAALGEAQRELLVEAVEAADVGEDHDARRRRLVRDRAERREPVAVGRLEHEVVVRDGGAGDRAGSAARSRRRSTWRGELTGGGAPPAP